MNFTKGILMMTVTACIIIPKENHEPFLRASEQLKKDIMKQKWLPLNLMNLSVLCTWVEDVRTNTELVTSLPCDNIKTKKVMRGFVTVRKDFGTTQDFRVDIFAKGLN